MPKARRRPRPPSPLRADALRRLLGSPRHGARADYVVVGLGNPGSEFRRTRHNLGADAVALVAQRHDVRLAAERGTHAEVGQWRRADGLVVLAVPRTYMNESGQAAAGLVKRFGPVEVDRVIVVHDELDLPVGRVRVKAGGGTAGHNGLKSVHAHLHDEGYLRVRIGIGKPPGRQQGADHVLRPPNKAESDALEVAVQVAADAVEAIIDGGVEAAMTRFNTESPTAP